MWRVASQGMYMGRAGAARGWLLLPEAGPGGSQRRRALPLGEDEWPYALPCRCLPDGREFQLLDQQDLTLLPAEHFDRRARIQGPPDAL